MLGSRSFSGPYSVQMRENTDQENSKYGDYLGNNCLISELKQPGQQLRWIFFLESLHDVSSNFTNTDFAKKVSFGKFRWLSK